MRVLAARDNVGGKVPLYQGMSAKDSLVLASSADFLQGCTAIKSFKPGQAGGGSAQASRGGCYGAWCGGRGGGCMWGGRKHVWPCVCMGGGLV